MNELIKKFLLGVLSAATITAIATTGSTTITSKEHAVKIENIERRLTSCENGCEVIKRDIYRPSWEKRNESN